MSRIKSKGWYLINKNDKQEFMLKANSLVRVFCRSIKDITATVIDSTKNSDMDSHYILKVDDLQIYREVQMTKI